jgi:hypothetical protein
MSISPNDLRKAIGIRTAAFPMTIKEINRLTLLAISLAAGDEIDPDIPEARPIQAWCLYDESHGNFRLLSAVAELRFDDDDGWREHLRAYGRTDDLIVYVAPHGHPRDPEVYSLNMDGTNYELCVPTGQIMDRREVIDGIRLQTPRTDDRLSSEQWALIDAVVPSHAVWIAKNTVRGKTLVSRDGEVPILVDGCLFWWLQAVQKNDILLSNWAPGDKVPTLESNVTFGIYRSTKSGSSPDWERLANFQLHNGEYELPNVSLLTTTQRRVVETAMTKFSNLVKLAIVQKDEEAKLIAKQRDEEQVLAEAAKNSRRASPFEGS